MNYYHNLLYAMLILGVTLFVMSWDVIPPLFSKLRKVLSK
jgi:hypothetical protein